MTRGNRGALALGLAVAVAGTLQFGLSSSIVRAASGLPAAAMRGCEVMPGVYRTTRSVQRASVCQSGAAASTSQLRVSLIALLKGVQSTGDATFEVGTGRLCYWLTWAQPETSIDAFIVRASSSARVMTLFTGRLSASPARACLAGLASTLTTALSEHPGDYAVQLQTPSGDLAGELHNRLTTFDAQVGLPAHIVTGPDGNLWYTNNVIAQVARMTPDGSVTVYPVPLTGVATSGITVGADGALWFTVTDFGDSGSSSTPTAIGRITTRGHMTLYPLPSGSSPLSLVFGPDGAVWYTDPNSNSIGRLSLDGHVTRYPIPEANSNPLGITVGGDGNLWFVQNFGGVGRITPSGVITEFPAPNPSGGITRGPDGNIWFTDFTDVIYRITPAGVETTFPTGSLSAFPDDLVFDPAGRLTFTMGATGSGAQYIGRLNLRTGVINRFFVPSGATLPFGITIGPGRNIWFTELYAAKIGRMFHGPSGLAAP